MMLLIMWRGGVTPRVLIKKELFRGPFGWLLHRPRWSATRPREPRWRHLVREARSEPFLLILAAEGTRKKGEYWKSGFWRIARSANLPIARLHRRAHPHSGIRPHHHGHGRRGR